MQRPDCCDISVAIYASGASCLPNRPRSKTRLEILAYLMSSERDWELGGGKRITGQRLSYTASNSFDGIVSRSKCSAKLVVAPETENAGEEKSARSKMQG